MLQQNNEKFGLEITVQGFEENLISYMNGNLGRAINFKVYNKTDKEREIDIKKITYLTQERESMEHDWLDYSNFQKAGVLKQNSFVKATPVFLTSKLKDISDGDLIFIFIDIPKEGRTLEFSFQKAGVEWIIQNIETHEKEIPLTSKQIEKFFLNKIERLEAFEERFEISMQNFSIVNDSLFVIYCEVHPIKGTSIKEDFELQCVVYDLDGLILQTTRYRLRSNDFFGFEVANFTFYNDLIELYPQISKIRIYPKK